MGACSDTSASIVQLAVCHVFLTPANGETVAYWGEPDIVESHTLFPSETHMYTLWEVSYTQPSFRRPYMALTSQSCYNRMFQ